MSEISEEAEAISKAVGSHIWANGALISILCQTLISRGVLTRDEVETDILERIKSDFQPIAESVAPDDISAKGWADANQARALLLLAQQLRRSLLPPDGPT